MFSVVSVRLKSEKVENQEAVIIKLLTIVITASSKKEKKLVLIFLGEHDNDNLSRNIWTTNDTKKKKRGKSGL